LPPVLSSDDLDAFGFSRCDVHQLAGQAVERAGLDGEPCRLRAELETWLSCRRADA
jgi:hypothetical protein